MKVLTPDDALVELRREWAATVDGELRGDIERLARAIKLVRDVPPAQTRKAGA